MPQAPDGADEGAVQEAVAAPIVVGFVLSGALFLVGMNRSLVRSVVDATVRPSRRVWGGQDAVRLTDLLGSVDVITQEIIGAALVAVAPVPAIAASQTVAVRDNVFAPEEVRIEPGDSVVEIGPGLGALTSALSSVVLKPFSR